MSKNARVIDHDEILQLRAAVISARLTGSRAALLAQVSLEFIATLPLAPAPGEQVLMDLDALDTAGELADGDVPLAIWLANAVALAGGRREAKVFQDALDRRRSARPRALAKALGAASPASASNRSQPAAYPPIPVFISVAKQDLAREARQLRLALLRCDKLFDVKDHPEAIGLNDALVLVVGHRYDPSQETLVNLARSQRSRVLVYVMNPHVRASEPEHETSLAHFVERISASGASLFDDPEDLVVQVLADLRALRQGRMSTPSSAFGPDPWLSGLCLVSTTASAARGQVSVLAIIESVAATLVFAWVAVRLHTVAHIVLGCALAPLFLLRTMRSTEESIARLERFMASYRAVVLAPLAWSRFLGVGTLAWGAGVWWACLLPFGPATSMPKTIPGAMLWCLRLSIWGVFVLWSALVSPSGGVISAQVMSYAIRALSVVRVALKEPGLVFQNLGPNFYRSNFCVDSFYPPEILPGLEAALQTKGFQRKISRDCYLSELPSHVAELRAAHWWRRILAGRSRLDNPMTLHNLQTAISFYAVPLLVRFLLKGSLVVYAPCVWIAHTGMFADLSMDDQLRMIRVASISRLARWYACVVLALSAAKLYCVAGGPGVRAMVESARGWNPLGLLFLPEWFGHPFLSWHLAMVVNAILVFAVYLFADAALLRGERGAEWSAAIIRGALTSTRVLRATLTLWTVGCSLYLVFVATQGVPGAVP